MYKVAHLIVYIVVSTCQCDHDCVALLLTRGTLCDYINQPILAFFFHYIADAIISTAAAAFETAF